jgi:hypothetical protein
MHNYREHDVYELSLPRRFCLTYSAYRPDFTMIPLIEGAQAPEYARSTPVKQEQKEGPTAVF